MKLDIPWMMEVIRQITEESLRSFGVGRRKLSDQLFEHDEWPAKTVLRDEDICYETIKSTCSVPGCLFTSESLHEFDGHYNTSHRYSCSQCKKVLPSPHLLDLHVQEKHDSFFAVLALKKPSYCCYIEECKEKFMNPEERLEHGVNVHKIPKDFRFDQKPKKSKGKNKKSNEDSMEVDEAPKKFFFSNAKHKTFPIYTGKKFTSEKTGGTSKDVNMDVVVSDLKDSLPE